MTGLLMRLTQRSRSATVSALRPLARRYEAGHASSIPLGVSEDPSEPPRDAQPALATVDVQPASHMPFVTANAVERKPLVSALMPPAGGAPIAHECDGRAHMSTAPADTRRAMLPSAERDEKPRVEQRNDKQKEPRRGRLDVDHVAAAPNEIRPGEARHPANRVVAGPVPVQHVWARRATAKEAAVSEVHVHIGRIEVRAPTAAREKKRPAPRQPNTSLDEYLAKRRSSR